MVKVMINDIRYSLYNKSCLAIPPASRKEDVMVGGRGKQGNERRIVRRKEGKKGEGGGERVRGGGRKNHPSRGSVLGGITHAGEQGLRDLLNCRISIGVIYFPQD